MDIKNYEVAKYEYDKKRILSLDFETLGFDTKRKFIIYESNNTCCNCGNNKWLGENITIEIDHIDGNNKNNDKNNLRPLCPNCHSQTKSWRGRNKKNIKNKVSKKLLLDSLINNNWNFRQALLEVGLTPKGGNYKRCHMLLEEMKKFNILSSDIKNGEFDAETLINDFKIKGSFKKVGEGYNISDNGVRKICKRLGILEEVKKYVKKVKKFEVDIDTIKEDFKFLKSYIKVGKKYGVSDKTIKSFCVRNNIDEEIKQL